MKINKKIPLNIPGFLLFDNPIGKTYPPEYIFADFEEDYVG